MCQRSVQPKLYDLGLSQAIFVLAQLLQSDLSTRT